MDPSDITRPSTRLFTIRFIKDESYEEQVRDCLEKYGYVPEEQTTSPVEEKQPNQEDIEDEFKNLHQKIFGVREKVTTSPTTEKETEQEEDEYEYVWMDIKAEGLCTEHLEKLKELKRFLDDMALIIDRVTNLYETAKGDYYQSTAVGPEVRCASKKLLAGFRMTFPLKPGMIREAAEEHKNRTDELGLRMKFKFFENLDPKSKDLPMMYVDRQILVEDKWVSLEIFEAYNRAIASYMDHLVTLEEMMYLKKSEVSKEKFFDMLEEEMRKESTDDTCPSDPLQ